MFQFTEKNNNEYRRLISEHYYVPEQEAVTKLLNTLSFSEEDERQIQQRAVKLVNQVRNAKQKHYGVDALMHEFSLGCDEGIALMCLAEALLRIPDNETRYALIHDKLKDGDWKGHIGKSSSLFINAASYGLLISSKISRNYDDHELASALSRSFSKMSAPMMRLAMERAMRILGDQFVTGETMADALKKIKSREELGYRFSFDMLGEAAMTAEDAEGYFQDYVAAIHAVGKQSEGRDLYDSNGVSVKLSAIHPRYVRAQHQRVMDELYPRLKELFLLAKDYQIGLSIDAEEASRLELSLDLYERLVADPDFVGFDGLGFVVQAYSKRCPYVLDFLIDLARRHQRKLMVRLVKGAYWDSEIKWAQTDGVKNFPVYTHKVHTDISYLACAQKLLSAQDVIYPQFATHNVQTLSTIALLGEGKTFEFQCLHGMGETLYDNIVGEQHWGRQVRVYAPVGTHKTLLAYLVRRLLENGANSSFVHQLVDHSISVDKLVTPPWKKFAEFHGEPNRLIKPAEALYPHRKNSTGYNLSHELDLANLAQAMNAAQYGDAQSITACEVAHQDARPVYNPSQHDTPLANASWLAVSEAQNVFAAAQSASWSTVAASERAAILRKAADLYEAHTGLLIRLAIEEAGKTLANAVNELREAVDFLRYYAEQIEQLSEKGKLAAPLGVALCISPWNFPLAIFTGQVVAALAAGNSVVAKPAEQTPLIAYAAVNLLHQAGVPKAALQLVLGDRALGAALVGQPFNAVLFTGSTEVARLINQQLAEREDAPVLIAETGGMNTMVVDSSALAEQVVVDVLSSAFDSAGQRCSALRILLVQEDVADRMYDMISEAMQELQLGDPRLLTTDIGPVIDQEAQAQLQAYQAKMRGIAEQFVELTPPEEGHFVAPSLYEIKDLSAITREVFGPVLHFIRYPKAKLGELLAQINDKGYALTGGCHSRIHQTMDFVQAHLHCGNFYINRNIVGAVVGVQPFGGHGLSGTGPKAGGELYVQRLTQTRHYYTAAPIHESQVLPSITGEINTISYHPTKVALFGGDVNTARVAYDKLSAAGFVVQVEPEHPLAHESLVNLKVSPELGNCQKGVYLTALSAEKRASLAEHCSVVFVLHDWRQEQDMALLYHERSCSENVTAAGGNVTLMASIEN